MARGLAGDDTAANLWARSEARKTRARGLRSILEQVLLDIMFDLPTMENVSKAVVDEATILGEGKPLLDGLDQ